MPIKFTDEALHQQAIAEAKRKFKIWPSAYDSIAVDLRWDSAIDRISIKYGLRLDEFKKLKGSKGGKCNEGRGWYGLIGACKRGKKADDNTAKIKASKVELADKIRAKKGMRDRNAPKIKAPIPSNRSRAKTVRTKSNPDPVENKGRLGPSISPKNVISSNKHFTSESINNALDQIQSEGSAERISNIRSIIESQGIQSVFRGESSARGDQGLAKKIEYKGPKNREIPERIREYEEYKRSGVPGVPTDEVNWDFIAEQLSIQRKALSDALLPGGGSAYTIESYRHIVMDVDRKIYASSFTVTPKEIQDMADKALSPPNERPIFTVSGTGTGGVTHLATYLHEVGHQIQWISESKDPSLAAKGRKAKAVTKYGMTNNMENFAEGFTLWTLDAKGLKEKNPEMHDYIQESVASAMQAKKRLE